MVMCKQLEVSRSGYYAWEQRQPSQHEKRDEVLKVKIQESHKQSRGTYGSPRIHIDLKELGFHVGRKRIARLMKAQGIAGTPKKPYRATTDSRHNMPLAENILAREFNVDSLDKVWATDITYIKTWQGFLYLAVVIDLCSRRVVGWSMKTHLRTELVLNALRMACGRRQPTPGTIHHSDRGSQYASNDYQAELAKLAIICSMSRKGDCWDNSVVESFFATLKKELIYRHPLRSFKIARSAITEYIEVYYNRSRKHSTLGYMSPVDFEIMLEKEPALAA